MQNKNSTPKAAVSSTDQLMADHHVKVKGRIGAGLTRLTVDGEEFSFEPCRPGYVNLVNVKTNKAVGVVPTGIKINDAIELCVQELAKANPGTIGIIARDKALNEYLYLSDVEELIRLAKEKGYKNIEEIVAFAYAQGRDDGYGARKAGK